jgi:hypothetical protein
MVRPTSSPHRPRMDHSISAADLAGTPPRQEPRIGELRKRMKAAGMSPELPMMAGGIGAMVRAVCAVGTA